MSSTRYQRQPLQIYQDPVSYDHAPMPSMSSTAPKTSSPLRPIKNASSRRNIVLNPPVTGPSKASPLKSALQNAASPAEYGSKLNMIAMPPPRGSAYQTDSMEKKQPNMSQFKTGPQKALFTTFPSSQSSGKENYNPTIYPAPPAAYSEGIAIGNFSIEGIYGPKPQTKRVLMDAAPIQESRPTKKFRTDSESAPVTSSKADLQSEIHDDGTKPGHSYAMLIGMAILRAPNRRLTLAQIYKWISDTYSYYSASEPGWQNSIRHNLSLNKAFVKQERPKDDPGKGNYWAIEAGMEGQFLRDKPVKKSSIQNDHASVSVAPSASQEAMQSTYKALIPTPSDVSPSTPAFIPSEPSGPAAAEISSDATIPASDAFAPEEEQEEEESYLARPFSQPIRSSPPPMHSSPPIARHLHPRDDTPPPVPRFPTSSRSRTRTHKRGFASMDDSGYFSSLNSSVLRGPKGDHALTSEADRPRIKRGRAEEEIARIRGSSYDSPTKIRPFAAQSNTLAPPSSSPLRRARGKESKQMLPPLTPAVKLKPPVRPPPSVSPNTNLRMHRDRVRQLVGSPERGINSFDDNLSWSPAFNLDDAYLSTNFDTGFDIFADSGTDLLAVPGMGSPEKRSAKRLRADRAHSANVLADISNSNSNSNKSLITTPCLKFVPAPSLTPFDFTSPSKLFASESPSKLRSPTFAVNAFDLPPDDFFGAEFLTDEVTEFSGMDILQGFQKIGAGGQSNKQVPKGGGSRPGFGRSFTSRF
ncbi:MAG: hypothetical protein M1818_000275 [Claussenomyces sp. TS43310]|nr:MAG: hypothetical protein M1818_000275 [Claussenomyces sp. TS43310]